MAARRAFEVAIVGGGIAGASLAYFLAERGVTDVLLVEREAGPGRHATGRSAAVLAELDAVPALQRLKVLSAPFLRDPPPGFSAEPLLVRSGILILFREPLWSVIHAGREVLRSEGLRVETLSPAETARRVPALLPAELDGAVLLPDDGHIDVHELLSSYLRHARRRGVEQRFGVEVRGIHVEGGRCAGIVTDAGTVAARLVVNAAGAWAGTLGTLAGATPVPLTPCRRTIVTFAAPAGVDVRAWPLVASESHQVYFAPESGGLMLSPMDETPMAPCDAHADDLAVAGALERLGQLAPGLVPRTLGRRWAGLRTFTPDRVPVVGEDPRLPGFFWLAGQGGCGIETSPVLGQVAADLLLAGATARIEPALLAPSRFAVT